MRLGEFGLEFIFASGMDLRDNTYLGLHFIAPDGTETIKEDEELTLGVTDIYSTSGYLAAGSYVSYTFANGDIDQAGTWSCYLVYQDAYPRKFISDTVTFEIEA